MKTLILMRHAKSSWADSNLTDFERPLNGRGEKNAPQMGAWILERKRPDIVLCSRAARTRETYERSGISAEAMFPDALYQATAGTIVRHVQRLNDHFQTALVIGHNPGIGQAAETLLYAAPHSPIFDHYPTASCAIIEFEAEHWRDIGYGDGKLVDFATPKYHLAAKR